MNPVFELNFYTRTCSKGSKWGISILCQYSENPVYGEIAFNVHF